VYRGGGSLQKHPIPKGMQNQERDLYILQQLRRVVVKKRRVKMAAAAIDGTYFHN
jgi:hypothetical protein